MVVVDTSVVVDHLRRPSVNSTFSRLIRNHAASKIAVSLVSIQELYTGKSTRIQDEKTRLLSILANLEVISYDYTIAKKAGIIQRDLPIDIGFADAAIGATAITNGAKLLTLNPKHFRGIPKLVLYQR